MSAGTGFPTVFRTTQFASTMDVINLMRGDLYADSTHAARGSSLAASVYRHAGVDAGSSASRGCRLLV